VTLKPWVFSERAVTGTYPMPELHSISNGAHGTLDPTPFASLAPTAL